MEPETSTASQDAPPRGRNLLELVGPTVALATALLPAVGLATRWLAFAAASPPVPPTLEVAAASSLSELTAVGLRSSWLQAALFFVLFFGVRIMAPIHYAVYVGSERHKQSDVLHEQVIERHSHAEALIKRLQRMRSPERIQETQTEALKLLDDAKSLIEEKEKHDATTIDILSQANKALGRVSWIERVPIILVVAFWAGVVAMLFTFPWPQSLIQYGSALVATLFLRRRAARRGHLTLAATWPVAVFLLASSVVQAGFDGRISGISVGKYDFVEQSAADQGTYARLGHDSGFLYLRGCDTKTVILVQRNDIRQVTFLQPAPVKSQPSLLDLMRGKGVDLGLRDRCPRDRE